MSEHDPACIVCQLQRTLIDQAKASLKAKRDARPCISCSTDYIKDEGGDQDHANFKFCAMCQAASDHEQHEHFANRCKWCATQLRIALHLPCFGEKGKLHAIYET